jgi:hypothetical protein
MGFYYQDIEEAGYMMGNRKERFARCYNWTDAKMRQGCFFLGRREEENISDKGMWQKASRGTVSSVE